MSHAYYAEINLHITWHTKDNRPLLTPEVEKVAHEAITHQALAYRGTILRAVGGTEDHVHLAVSIPPTVLISEFIGRLKGYSSHTINEVVGQTDKFAWQTGYGVVTFGTRVLEWVVRYVLNQKAHHANGKTFTRLEQVAEAEIVRPAVNGRGEEGKPPEGG